ncbi:MAG: thiol reductant ABC exporter subunit CydD [Hyphomicrobiaceae bacterium]
MSVSDKAGAFLKAQAPRVAPQLRLAVALWSVNGLLVIVQAWLVASIIHAAAFGRSELLDIAHWLLALLPVFAARLIVTWQADQCAFRAAASVKRELRARLLRHIASLGPVGIGSVPTGRLVSAATESLQTVEPYFSRYLPAVSLATILPLGMLIVIVPSDWLSAIVLLVTAPLIPLFMVLIGDRAERMSSRQWQRLARMSGHLLDMVQGLATLKTFGASRRAARQVGEMAETYRRDTMAVLRVAFLSSLVLEFFATVSIAIVAVLIGFRLMWGELSFFNGLFVLLLAPEFYAPLRTLGAAYHARMEALGAVERVVEVLDLTGSDQRSGGRRWPPGSEPLSIRFENVHVAYPDGRVGLAGLDLQIKAGERVALVGPSGGGKSTVLNVLAGFVQPRQGRILINGTALDDLDPDEWRRQLCYLPQRPHMFDETIARNIAMALYDTPYDIEAVRAAASHAEADAFISALPNGYETRLGERGAGLSGGEVQRIAIARAFHRNGPLVLIDEATAHLDWASEQLVGRALNALAERRTVIMIAHRLATVRKADRIVVIDNGRVREQGRHDTLIRQNGVYAALVARMQPAASGGA